MTDGHEIPFAGDELMAAAEEYVVKKCISGDYADDAAGEYIVGAVDAVRHAQRNSGIRNYQSAAGEWAVMDYLRRESRYMGLCHGECISPEIHACCDGDAALDAIRSEDVDRVRAALDSLTDRERAITDRVICGGESIVDVAKNVGVHRNHAAKIMDAAAAKLSIRVGID